MPRFVKNSSYSTNRVYISQNQKEKQDLDDHDSGLTHLNPK